MKKLIITGTILGIASITGMLVSAMPVEVESEPVKSVKEVKEVKKVEPVIEKEQPVQEPVVVTPEPVKQPEPTPPAEQTPEQIVSQMVEHCQTPSRMIFFKITDEMWETAKATKKHGAIPLDQGILYVNNGKDYFCY